MTERMLTSLFSGIGGFEVAAGALGLETKLVCEADPAAQAVLRERFPNADLVADVRELQALPSDTWMLTAGFPCQDLSSVGQKLGITGSQSALVDEVFRLLEDNDPEWLVLENVMFMLHLAKGAAMEHVISNLERLGFNWAYRLLDTSEFGLPQRRRRVYFLASRTQDAATAMFNYGQQKKGPPSERNRDNPNSWGFYWTEGTHATGMTEDGIPPLKAGSTIGIPSPPAIVFPCGTVGTPSICDAERLQGFRKGWTKPASKAARESMRWRLVGNAVSVPVARHVIRAAIDSTGSEAVKIYDAQIFNDRGKWPDAAFGRAGQRFSVNPGRFRGMRTYQPIHQFLKDDLKPLSAKATNGFLRRAYKGNLRFPEGFLDILTAHAALMDRKA
jgi:DNA (cytosine-5)-methyltransferase 1